MTALPSTGQFLDRPVFIVGVPRSGTSLLFTLLSSAPMFFSLRTEGQEIWWRDGHPSTRDWQSDVLTTVDATPEIAVATARAFYAEAVPNRGVIARYSYAGLDGTHDEWVERITTYIQQRNPFFHLQGVAGLRDAALEQVLAAIKRAHQPLRFVEKTPRSCLRVGYINAIFPDALFIYIKRDGRAAVSSLIDAWQDERKGFCYDLPVPLRIPGLTTSEWRFILPPGWREYVDRPLEEVAAFQWREGNRIAMAELANIDPSRVHTLFYEDLVDHADREIARVCQFIDAPYQGRIRQLVSRPPITMALTPPEPEKWKKHNATAIQSVWSTIEPTMEQMGYYHRES